MTRPVAVTACPPALHIPTWQKLSKLHRKQKAGSKVETQGSIGIENELMEEDIKAADIVIR